MRLRLLNGDISRLAFRVDAIVTSSNASLSGNGNPAYWRFAGRQNVDGAIRAESAPGFSLATGQAILSVGQAISSPATGNLSARCSQVIHINSPEGAYGREAGSEQSKALLRSCYSNAISLADSLHSETVALPAIGCGVREWKASESGEALCDAISGVRLLLKRTKEVIVVCSEQSILRAFSAVAEKKLGKPASSMTWTL